MEENERKEVKGESKKKSFAGLKNDLSGLISTEVSVCEARKMIEEAG